jgi:DNA-binding transcriptional MerR regulator
MVKENKALLAGEISMRTGLSIHTIRFYERIGLIPRERVQRLGNNYRNYDEGVVETLRFVKFAQSIGFTLAELSQLTKEGGLGRIPRLRQIALLETKLDVLNEKVSELDAMRRLVRSKIRALRGAGRR